MATIDSKDIIDAIIAAGGKQYSDEPAVSRIVEYTNANGRRTWGVTWENERDQHRYDRVTEYVRDPVIIFDLHKEG